jgi:hypothetical protein
MSAALEVLRLDRALRAQGINPIVLKGIAVALRAYGRLGLRYNHDIDLLVPENTVEAASQVLATAGYIRTGPPSSADSGDVRTWLRTHKDMQFERSDNGFVVELHWRLFDNPKTMPFDVEAAALGAFQLTSQHVLHTLPDELELLYLCVHGAEHAWSRLKWLADVAALVFKMTPQTIEARYSSACAQNLGRPMASALLLCSELFGVSAPEHILLSGERQWRTRSLRNVALRLMSQGGAHEIEDLPFATTRKNISHYLVKDGLSYWWREFGYDLADESRAPMPVQLKPFGMLLRPLLWAQRRAMMIARRSH